MDSQPEIPAAPKRKSRKRLWFYGAFAVPVIALLAAIVVPNLVKARVHPCKNACVNNLRQIDGAKEQWALENKKSAGTPVTKADEPEINKYIKGGEKGLKCPSEDTNAAYIYNAVDAAPTCTFNKTPGEVHAL